MQFFTPRRILCIKLRAMGDTLLMTAALQEIKKAYPLANLDVVVTQEWTSLLEGEPQIRKVWPYERVENAIKRSKIIAGLALKLRKEKYDLVINFHASPSSATLAASLGAKVRAIHFHGTKHKNRFSTVVIPGKGEAKPQIERDLDCLRALKVSVNQETLPKLHLSAQELSHAKERLERLSLFSPLLILGIGASRPSKIWPLDRMAAIAIKWCDDRKGSVAFLHSKNEEDLAKKFWSEVDRKLVEWYKDPPTRKKIRSQIIALNQLPLRELSGIMSQAQLYVGNDSGPKHLAIASGLKTLTLFGPEDPFEWHPYSQVTHPYFYIPNLPCRKDQEQGLKPWCGVHECVVEEHRCMKMISEDLVYLKIKELTPE